MKIDSHQHFWRYSATDYPWIGAGMERLARDYLPADLEPPAAAAGIGGTVAVQARQTLEETRWLLELAERHPLIRGVVGWVDLRSVDVHGQLREFAAREQFVGVRHVVQDEPDPRFLLGKEFFRGLEHLHPFGLTYDGAAARAAVRARPPRQAADRDVDEARRPARVAARHRGLGQTGQCLLQAVGDGHGSGLAAMAAG
jgi:predicted TIM-barrel fold metal-dependent hydrolase